MERGEMKRRVCEAIDRHRNEIIGLGRAIRDSPELGFKEHKSAATVARTFASHGIPCQEKLAITGVKGLLAGGAAGPTVGILGELDSLLCPDSPHVDQSTGAAHTCGHNAQVATCVGAGIGLRHSGVLAGLAGRVACFAVPAEEFVEIAYRLDLQRRGEIEFLGGKAELVRRGHLDDIQMAMLVHAAPSSPGPKLLHSSTSNGFVAKMVRFRGKASHAGVAPEKGVNALNMMALALMNINAQRETFRDEDTIRVHQIVTRGGDLVNIVPEDVRMEMFVRGKTVEAIQDANRKVSRSLEAAALAVGGEVEIQTIPGYLPRLQETALTSVLVENFAELIGRESLEAEGHGTGSSDTGDLSHLMPMVEVKSGGFNGSFHTASHTVADEEQAYIVPAKAMAMTAVDLLADDARMAKEILAGFTPRMTRAEYLAFLRGIAEGTNERA
jgi:amidohydrolase